MYFQATLDTVGVKDALLFQKQIRHTELQSAIGVTDAVEELQRESRYSEAITMLQGTPPLRSARPDAIGICVGRSYGLPDATGALWALRNEPDFDAERAAITERLDNCRVAAQEYATRMARGRELRGKADGMAELLVPAAAAEMREVLGPLGDAMRAVEDAATEFSAAGRDPTLSNLSRRGNKSDY